MRTRLDKEALFSAVGYAPHEGQLEVHRSQVARRVLACGVRWGKSTVCVHEALSSVLAPGPSTRGWIVTPTTATTELLTEHLFALLRLHFAHRIEGFEPRERRMVVRNLAGNACEVSGRTADRPAALLGASLDWVVVDEAARVREEVFHILLQRLVDRRGWALIASTPRGVSDWFHREHRRGVAGDDGYAAWSGPTWENPAVPQDLVVAEKSRLSAREFLAEYGGQFVGEAGVECAACGWGKDPYQRATLYPNDWRGLRRCDVCMRTVTAAGEPVGYEREDGSLGFQVMCGPDDGNVIEEVRGSQDAG